MSAAERAVTNAIPLEVKKDGLQQRQNGDWVLRLVIQAADMDPRLTNAAMGTRYQAALVEVDENEQPVEPKQRIPWRNLTPTTQAGLRCQDERFKTFLASHYGFVGRTDEAAAAAVRNLCGVGSRSELSINKSAAARWHEIDAKYREWAHL